MRLATLLIALPLCAWAQVSLPTEFPAEAVAPSAEALQQVVSGKKFRARLSDGTLWRLDYKSSGYAFIDTSRGFRDTGRWRVEGSQLCVEWQRVTGGCNEMRLKGGAMYVKRTSNGEVVALEPD